MLYIMCISVRQYVCFIKQVTVGWCTMVVFLCLCCLCFGNPLWAFWQSVSNVLAICQQPQGADLSCPHIRIRHAFAIRWDTFGNPSAALSQSVQNAFTERSQRVRYLCVTYSPCKSMVFAPQKYGFWRAKTPFLHCKNPLFGVQEVGFCKALISRWLHCFCVSGRCSNTINVRNRRYSQYE